MKNIFIMAVFLLFVFTPMYAQEDGEGNKEKSPLFSLDINLAPNTDGLLEGSVELALLWSPWIYTSAAFSTSGSTSVYRENFGSTTSINSTKNLDFYVLRTRPDFLKWKFSGNNLYTAINTRLLLNMKWINQEKYGYMNVPILGFSVFYEYNDIFNMYPCASSDIELKLGPVLLKGYFLSSIMILYTNVEGEYYYSVTGNPNPTPYSLKDRGFEIRAGGTAAINPIPEIEINYSFDYLRHAGNAKAVINEIIAIGVTEYMYIVQEIKHSLSLSIDINGYKPMIGINYITYVFSPVNFPAITSYSSSRWGFLFGTEYK